MAEKHPKKAIITATYLLLIALSFTPVSKQAIPSKSNCKKTHCVSCSFDERCYKCERGYGVEGNSECFKCPDGCNSCSADKFCTECSQGYELETGGKCEESGGGLNWVTIIVVTIILIFVLMLGYTCYKTINESNAKSGGNRVWTNNNKSYNNGNRSVPTKINQNLGNPREVNVKNNYGNLDNKPNNLAFVNRPDNLAFVAELDKENAKKKPQLPRANDKESWNRKRAQEEKDLKKPPGVKCVNGICTLEGMGGAQPDTKKAPSSSVPKYLGNDFIRGDTKAIPFEVRRAEFLGLYFSASWCGPCRQFTDKLIKQYEKMNKNGKKLEIILVTSDKTKQGFEDYYKKMPWLAIPFGSPNIQKTKSQFTIKGIPKLVMTCQGKVLTEDGWKFFGYGDGNPDSIYQSLKELKEDIVEHKWDHHKPSKNYPFLGKSLLKGKSKHSASSLDQPEFVGFYMGASWCGPCKSFTPILKQFYEKVGRSKLEIVFCTNDRSQEEFLNYFGTMPWLGISKNDNQALHEAWQNYPAKGIPKLTIVNNKTKGIVTVTGTSDLRNGVSNPENTLKKWRGEKVQPKAEPVIDVSTGLGFLGNKFIDNKGSSYNLETIKKSKIFGLYFSASWCPPCRNFTSKLIPFYENVNKSGKRFEIVLVRSDRDLNAFNGYFGKMPWKALPFDANGHIGAAKKKFAVRGIPFMAVMNDKGEIVSKNAVAEIMYCKDNDKLLQGWRDK